MTDLMIDPGTPFGWSLWRRKQLVRSNKCVQTGPTWEARVDLACFQLRELLVLYKPYLVYCERPIQMGGHTRGANDSFVKLCLTVGRFMGVCCDKGIPMKFVPASWLGQLNDTAIRHRVNAIGGEAKDPRPYRGLPEHAIDSVAMALFVYGKWPRG